MAYPKEERNRRFLEDWQVHNLNNEQLAQKYGFTTIGGVKALKHRLRQKQRLSEGSSALREEKLPSTSPSTSTNPHRDKRMTFWLPEETIENIKARAGGQRQTASAFLRDLLKKHL